MAVEDSSIGCIYQQKNHQNKVSAIKIKLFAISYDGQQQTRSIAMFFSFFSKRGFLLELKKELAIDSLFDLIGQLRSDVAELRQEVIANSHYLRTRIMPSVAELTTAVQGLVEAWNNEKNEILSKIAELESAIQSSEIPASLLEQITTLTSDIRSTVEVPVDVPVVEEPATDELPPNTTEGANQVLGDQPTDDDAGF